MADLEHEMIWLISHQRDRQKINGCLREEKEVAMALILFSESEK